MQRVRRVAVAAVLAIPCLLASMLFAADPAFAHASILEVTPAQGSVVAHQPRAVELRFSEPVQITAGSVTITDPGGEAVPGLSPRSDPTDGATMVVDLPDGLADGTYHVLWRVVSLDSHPEQGRFDFAIGHASTPLARAGPSSLEGPGLLGGAGRAVAIAGALCVAGLAAFPLLVLAPARRRLARAGVDPDLAERTVRRLRGPLVWSATVAALGTSAVLVDTAAGAGSPLLDTALGTRTGVLLVTRLVLLVLVTATLIAPGRLALSVPRLATAIAGGMGILATFSLSSHAAAAIQPAVAVPLDVAHLAAAGVWIGGLLGLAVAGARRRLAADSAAALFGTFSVVAQLAMITVLVTGAYAVLLQVSDPSDLGETRWGLELVTKVALWVSVLLFAAANAITFVPTLARKAEGTAHRLAAADRLRSAVRVEIGIAAALVGVAAIMAATPQPAQERLADAQQEALDHVGTTRADGVSQGYVARVRTTRIGVGPGTATILDVVVRTEHRRVGSQAVTARLADNSGAVLDVPLEARGAGAWSSSPLPVSPGRYHLTTRFDRRTGTVSIPVDVVVPADPPGLAAAAAGKVGNAPEARARRALELTVLGMAALLGLAVLGYGRRRLRSPTQPERAQAVARTGYLEGTRP